MTPRDQIQDQGEKVEILFCGSRAAVLINGALIGRVVSVETPRRPPVLGLVNLSFIASEIVDREVSKEEYEAAVKGRVSIEGRKP
ncbi:hypothetical protein [Delftia sp.]|uniref:hypothetical protein n=1 Tax=Delftia sp. TaxID=1886637 RepID=UPI00259CBBF0|nr:hypothetical protein [Delftia sp.]